MFFCIKSRAKFNNGFSFVEIISVLAIISILASIITFSFSKIGGKQALDKTTVSIVSILNEARSMSISSKDFSNYGVRIESDKVTSFKNVYGNENKIYELPSMIYISNFSVSNDIIFNKLSGDTSATGTITLSIKGDSLNSSMIRVSQTGLIEKK